MYDSMQRLVFVELLNSAGAVTGQPVEDVWYVEPRGTGSIVHFRSGRLSLVSTETPAQVVARLEAKWDEWLAAFPA